MKTTMKWAGAALAASLIGGAQPSYASSHREAPLISDDPSADATDFYMFRTPSADTTTAIPNSVTFVANYWPLQEPGGGPNWVRFGDKVLYEIKIDNNGDAVEDITYQFRFTTSFKAGTTSFLFAKGQVATLADANLQVTQSYSVTRIDKNGTTVLASNVPVPPPDTGDYTFNSSAAGTGTITYSTVANAAITSLTSGAATVGKVFAGQRDDPFFADLGAIFDLVRIRCNNTTAALSANAPAGCAGTPASAKGVDFVGGYNVHSIVLQVPITQLTLNGDAPTTSSKTSILGAWTSASRPRVSIRRAPTAAAALAGVNLRDDYGQWVQVSRLGLPLINEVIVPVGLKDYYNSTQPSSDLALFTGPVGGPLLTDPELARALKALYGINIPAAGRTDLVELTQFNIATSAGGTAIGPFKGASAAYALTAADILRLDVATAAPADFIANPKGALGVVGVGIPTPIVDASVGFPNGRRLQDDVVDILEEVVGGGVLRGQSGASPNNILTDAVNTNDRAFLTVFPYVPLPWSGSQVGGAFGTTAGNNSLLHQFH